MGRSYYFVVPFAFLPTSAVPVFLQKEQAQTYMADHAEQDLRMVVLSNVHLAATASYFHVATTLEDCGVKVHAVLSSPVLAAQRELIPITENRLLLVPAVLQRVEHHSLQRAS